MQIRKEIADVATRLCSAPEILCGTMEFRGGVDVQLTPKASILRRPLHFARKTEAQSRSLAKNRGGLSPRPRNRKYDLRLSLPFSPSNIELIQRS